MFEIEPHLAAAILAVLVLLPTLIDTIYAYKDWFKRWWEEKFPKKS